MNGNEAMKMLQEPFAPEDIGWRVQSCGISNNSKPWVKVLAYVQARAIQRRLDEVFGWNGWTEEYRSVGNNMLCRLGVKFDGEWIYKENGASETQVEAFKGGISGSFKRVAASGYGIGRYLYNLTEAFAQCSIDKPASMDGWETAKTKEKKTIYWKVPTLPIWALPTGYKPVDQTTTKSSTTTKAPVQTENNDLKCSDCGGEINQAVATYSEKQFGRKLCRTCQAKAKKAV